MALASLQGQGLQQHATEKLQHCSAALGPMDGQPTLPEKLVIAKVTNKWFWRVLFGGVVLCRDNYLSICFVLHTS